MSTTRSNNHNGGERAYDSLRLVWFPWQRARRIRKEEERRIAIMKRNVMQPILASGYYHSLAIRHDGSVACWGRNEFGEAPPDGVDGEFVAVAGGFAHSLALRRDGCVACWGAEERGDDYDDDITDAQILHGQAPPDGVDGNFVAIAAGAFHSLALRSDGGVACWGRNYDGEAPPDASPSDSVEGDFVAIAAGDYHSLALQRDAGDECVECWGDNTYDQAPPDGVDGDFVAIAAGAFTRLPFDATAILRAGA